MKILFFFSLFMIFYIYLGYPVTVSLLSSMKKRKVHKGDYEPFVSILIAAYNEEQCIETTVINKLKLNYPREKLEIIVISDGSTDRTDEIVRKYKGRGVTLLRQEPRHGKTSALNLAVPQAKGEIIVFADANSIYDLDALKMLVRNFADSKVGYVTGKMIYTNPDGTLIGDGCTAYMKYENFLREQETNIGSVVGVDGGIDAVRKILYISMKHDQLPDFVLPLKVVEQGYRVVFEANAILREPALAAARDEYRMRVRVALRALWAISDMRQMLSWRKFGLFAWQLWTHKVLRYICFVFLLGAWLGNLVLWGESAWYRTLFVLQNLGYLCALVPTGQKPGGYFSKLTLLMRYFSLLNVAAAHAVAKFLLGYKQVLWTPRKG